MTRVFFASDIHGSERVFKKFINAAAFYKADALVLGGDITGKIIVPIVEESDQTYTLYNLNETVPISTSADLEIHEHNIRSSGYYPFRTTRQEYEDLKQDPEKLDRVFMRLMIESLTGWMELANDRLKNTSVRCFISPGNDDRLEIDSVLQDCGDSVINPEGKVANIDEHHEMISLGFSNITPWKAPRDIPDDELGQKIEQLAPSVEDMRNCIFNFHCPPYGSGLDTAPKLDEDLSPKVAYGQMEIGPVGSKAVRKSIEKHQPMLGLHGHIHESRGALNIGRTLCINPGSEYSSGILRGAIINLDRTKVRSSLLVSG